jgi:alpha-1,3-mannosyltransferase
LQAAFDFGRVFLYQWTVNWKFLAEEVFLSKLFATLLVFALVFTLVVFTHSRWLKSHNGLLNFLQLRILKPFNWAVIQDDETYARIVASVLFTGHFIGIVFSRSLHYQFYSWYFWTMPFLLWTAFCPKYTKRQGVRLLPIFVVCAGNLLIIEYCWNVFPATYFSSLLLFMEHIAILFFLYLQAESLPVVAKRKGA